ncbi:MAG: GNAT family N-acetyltransferase [Jiangellaceae bacterium]
MLVDQVVTYLAMTSPDQLRPGRLPPVALDLRRQTRPARAVRAVHDRIARPHHWSSLSWSEAQWEQYLNYRHLHHWIAWVGDHEAGLISLRFLPRGEVEIDTFGLVPEYVGQGFGGNLLALAVRLAWDFETSGAGPVRRVWLHTSSLDHPHALPNYRSRGFRQFRITSRTRDIPPSLTPCGSPDN